MRTRTRALLVPVLFLASAALAGARADDDPIAAQLLKDKEAYVADVEKAKEVMLKAFDKHYESVRTNKSLKIELQLAQLEKIEAEKKAFDENGVPPALPALKVALSEYRTAQKKAETACKAAFEKAAKAYRDKGDIKAAGLALEEMKEFLAKSPAAAAAGAGAVVLVSANGGGKVIGLQGGNADEGARIVTADYVKGDQTQLWKVVPAADGWVYVENAKSGLVMAVAGRNNGAEGRLEKKKDGDAGQLWKLTPVPNQKDAIKLTSKTDPDKILCITQGSKNAGVRLILWDDSNNSATNGFGLFPPK